MTIEQFFNKQININRCKRSFYKGIYEQFKDQMPEESKKMYELYIKRSLEVENELICELDGVSEHLSDEVPKKWVATPLDNFERFLPHKAWRTDDLCRGFEML